MSAPIKVLFVCGKNKRRSPTAAKVFENDRRMHVRSAGLGETSRCKVNASDLLWADLVLVMQRKYARRIQVTFNHLDSLPPMESLDIGDDYKFMDPELIAVLRTSVDTAIENYHLERENAEQADS
ncbi:MAG: protein-tyrosine-phosphatase [Terrimicrobiaceae bacterium]